MLASSKECTVLPFPEYWLRPETIAEFNGHVCEAITGTNTTIYGVTKNAGAGHERQRKHFSDYLRLIGIPPEKIGGTIEVNQGQPTLFDLIYPRLQQYPGLYTIVDHAFNLLPTSVADHFQQGMADIESVSKIVGEAPKDGKKMLFVCTHSIGAISVYEWARVNNCLDQVTIIELCPDPWTGFSLATMTSSLTLNGGDKPHHFVCTHNLETAEEYRRVRPNSSALVYGLGTSSHPAFLLDDVLARSLPHEPYLHLHLSGNSVLPYHEALISLLKAGNGQITGGQIGVTLHAMTHSTEGERILRQAKLYGLPNVRLVCSESREEAIRTRAEMMVGNDGHRLSTTNAGKGEMDLENTGASITVTPRVVAAHELNDAIVGQEEFHCILLPRDPNPAFQRLQKATEQRRSGQLPLPPQSFTPFMLLAALDSELFQREVVPQINRCQQLFAQIQQQHRPTP